MKWISFSKIQCRIYCLSLVNFVGSFCFFAYLLVAVNILQINYAIAESPPAYRQQHPLEMMHDLPTGELPGWSKNWWFNFETSNGNVWNAPLNMVDKRTGKVYKYTADYEQINAFLEFGHAFNEQFAASIAVPYVSRSGGILDSFIDSYHVFIGNRRYSRNYYPKNQNIFEIKTDGTSYYQTNALADGVSNIKLKLKYWFAQWMGTQKSSCPCGLAISSQTKFPVQDEKFGGTTGHIDESILLHFGIPLFTSSSMSFTAGNTFLGDNPAIHNWPRYDNIILYEMNLDLALSSSWGILLNARAESPFLDESKLTYTDLSTDPVTISNNRAASGWNSLVHWRGTESIGVRYRTSAGDQWQFILAEDWGIGSYDSIDNMYSNNAPDINFVLQTQINW